jgi:hypothetical protein
MHQSRELARVVNQLEVEGVPVIPFKGPVLGPMAYGNFAYRHSLDLDLLVRPDDFSHAEHLLHELGYVPYRVLDEADRFNFVEWHASDDYWHPELKVMVELHKAFFKDIIAEVLDIDETWDRHGRMDFVGIEVRHLALEDLVIYLCAHGAQHRWAKLKWLCDLAGLMHRHPNIDWAVVKSRARRTGSHRMVQLGLYLVHHHFKTQPPRPFRQSSFPDSATKRLADMVLARWTFSAPEAEVDPLQEFWFHIREREHWRDRVPYLLHSLRLAVKPTEKDHALWDLPKSMEWFYYLIRPVRLARDYAWPVIKDVLGRGENVPRT